MLLAIETSSLVSSVALLHDDTLRAELTIQARLTHSEQLMPHIADMLDKASVKKSQIDGVAVAVGPGSFTGLRIGLATAKGLSFAWNVPIVGVTTPVSLAWNFVGVSDRICTLIDAQKGNVYAGVYRWDRTTLTTEKKSISRRGRKSWIPWKGKASPSSSAVTAPSKGAGISKAGAPCSAWRRRRWSFPVPAASPWQPMSVLPPVITTTA